MNKLIKLFSFFAALAFVFIFILPVKAQMPTDIPAGGPPSGGNYGPPANIPSGDQMGPPAGMMGGPSEEEIQAREAAGKAKEAEGLKKQLEGMKKGALGMEKALKQFEAKFAALEKKGLEISSVTREKLNSLRTSIETIKNAQAADEIQNIDQQAMEDQLNTLGDDIGKYQQMQGLKKMLASMERGVASFDKRVNQLVEKQGIVIPEDIKSDLDKLKAGLQAIRDAKNPEALDATNPDELGDLMEKVNESRPRLEMLAKWPRILKQADQQIAGFQKALVKTKVLVDRLSAKGVDVSADYTAFEQDVTALKTTRDEADALMKAGQSDDAFTKMEDNFFNKLDDVGEHQRVIQTMSNLSRFTVEFKRSMADAQKNIQRLAKRKLDTTELQSIYDQALAKGNEIVAMIGTKPIDEEAILAAMDTMENLKQDFQNKAEELAGGKTMPWETKSPTQFQAMKMPKDFNKYIPQPTTSSSST